MYDAIRCPTLVLRGAQSDILLHDTAVEMTTRGPQGPARRSAGVGHAPMFLDESAGAHRPGLPARRSG
jgi:pimeloyl-ACP methyl ester carboxylesterase